MTLLVCFFQIKIVKKNEANSHYRCSKWTWPAYVNKISLSRFYVTLADNDTISLKALEKLLANDSSVFPPNSGRSIQSHALFCTCDVSDETSVSSCIASTIEKFSGLDVLVNNAALASPWIGGKNDSQTQFDAVPVSNFRNFVEINLIGPYICSRYAAPHLRTSKGCIINISSTRALQSEANNEGYSASKAGLIGLTQAMAVSFAGSGVRVNAVSPGWIDVRDMDTRQLVEHEESTTLPPLTESDHSQHPAGRVGVPNDITKLVEFLADDGNGFITGQVIFKLVLFDCLCTKILFRCFFLQNFVVDGGMTKKMIYEE